MLNRAGLYNEVIKRYEKKIYAINDDVRKQYLFVSGYT